MENISIDDAPRGDQSFIGAEQAGLVPPEAATTADKEAYIALMKKIQDLMASIQQKNANGDPQSEEDAQALSDALNELKRMKDENRLPSHMLDELTLIFPFFSHFLTNGQYAISVDSLAGLLASTVDGGSGPVTLNSVLQMIKGTDHSFDDDVTSQIAWDVVNSVNGDYEAKQAKFKEAMELSKSGISGATFFENLLNLVQTITPDPCRLPTTHDPITSFNEIPQYIIQKYYQQLGTTEADWTKVQDPKYPGDPTKQVWIYKDDNQAYINEYTQNTLLPMAIAKYKGQRSAWANKTPQEQQAILAELLQQYPPSPCPANYVANPPSAGEAAIFARLIDDTQLAENYIQWVNDYTSQPPATYLPPLTPQQTVDILNEVQGIDKLLKQLEATNPDKSSGSLYDTMKKLKDSFASIVQPIKDALGSRVNEEFKENCVFALNEMGQMTANVYGTATIGIPSYVSSSVSVKLQEWIVNTANDDTLLTNLETALTSFNTSAQNKNSADQTQFQSVMEQMMNVLNELFDIFKAIRKNIS